jgi:hypothetical protein
MRSASRNAYSPIAGPASGPGGAAPRAGSHQEQLRRKEEHGTRTRQLEDQLKRVSAQLEEAQRKSSTSLRQQEGLARQDLFGEELQRRFPTDLIKVTGAGKRGPTLSRSSALAPSTAE